MITIGRDTCRVLDRAIRLEWLVTNGLGGYASGTVSGVNTRRYHGLLVAALQAPIARTLLLAKIEEEIISEDRSFYLGANEFHDGTINPNGYIHLREVRIEDSIPTFVYDVPGASLTKTIWMDDGQNTTNVLYKLEPGSHSVTLRASLFVNYRDFHHETSATPDWTFRVADVPAGIEIAAFPGATTLRVRSIPGVRFIQTGVWYWRYLHRIERDRGLDNLDDLYTPGLYVCTLDSNQSFAIQASTDLWSDLSTDAEALLGRRRDRQSRLWLTSPVAQSAVETRDVVVAADGFVVHNRPRTPAEPVGGGTIAGYHWFCEWGRDTMIALPGLLVANARYAEAKDVMRRYARLVDHGQIPNRLPDEGTPPEYNTIDASFWFFAAIARYLEATHDDEFLAEIYPTLVEIIRWHRLGTRFGIGVDEVDGLLSGGAPGHQLTWMDAKVGDWVVTPRRGKPVEVNALWYNALRLMHDWSRRVAREDADYQDSADQAYDSFNRRFWNPERGYLFDVVDGESGDDSALRPNQVFAIGLTYPTLDARWWNAVLSQIETRLLTPYGLRSLSPDDPAYIGHYGGDQHRRDSAYHQGTVWPWLLGGYADACHRAGRDVTRLRFALAQLLNPAGAVGLGSIGEVFDGDPPHAPGGCISQAWSVAEVLRAWHRVRQE